MPRKRKLKNVVDQIFVISKEIEKLINKKLNRLKKQRDNVLIQLQDIKDRGN